MRSREVGLPLLVALLWSILLIPAAIYLPIGDPANLDRVVNGRTVSSWVSLVHIQGFSILWLVAIPLGGVVLVGLCLILHDRLGSPHFAEVAWAIAVAVLLGALAGTVTFLIGVAAAPTGIFLLIAVNDFRRASTRRQSPRQRARGAPTYGSCGHVVIAPGQFCTTCGQRLEVGS